MRFIVYLNKLSILYCFKNSKMDWALVMHAFNPSTGDAEGGQFEASILYTVSSRTDSYIEKSCLKSLK